MKEFQRNAVEKEKGKAVECDWGMGLMYTHGKL